MNEQILLPLGQCPYCDGIRTASLTGYVNVWGGSPEMFEEYKRRHDAGHPEVAAGDQTSPTTI